MTTINETKLDETAPATPATATPATPDVPDSSLAQESKELVEEVKEIVEKVVEKVKTNNCLPWLSQFSWFSKLSCSKGESKKQTT